MTHIIAFQNWILHLSPALIPVLGILYSFVTSPHCTIMCSPFLPKPKDRGRFFIYRTVSYTLVGALFGSLGAALKSALEFQLVAMIAFIIFSIVTLVIMGFRTFPDVKVFSGLHKFESAFKGLFFSLIPCHSLSFFYSLAVLTGTTFGGASVLFSHALATMPALVHGQKIFEFPWIRKLLPKKLTVILILILGILNVLYLASRIFNSDFESRSKILFCF